MTHDYKRLMGAPRCLAKTRSGGVCQSPAVKGRKRCRMHGGTSPGAPKGNRNAFKHGREYGQARFLIAAQTGAPTSDIPADLIEAKVAVLRAKRAIRKQTDREPAA